MKQFYSGSGMGKQFIAAILLLPAILAALVLQYNPPPYMDLFVYGGPDVFVYNVCIFILTPYFILFLLALGDLYVSRLPNEDLHPLQRADLRLISFFVGCGVLTIFGFILGLLKLLYFWVCFPIFVIVLYFYFLQPNCRQTTMDLRDWIRAQGLAGAIRPILLVLRVALMLVIASLVLSKGILLELFKDGGLHQYFAYFVDTRLYHSTWMDPSHPVLFDYLAGRGQGVHLFFTSFTNQFTIQIIGTIYLIMIGVIARQVIVLLLSAFGKENPASSLRSCLPDLVMLLVLTSPILDMETARFHLQTGVFFLFLCWAGSLFLLLESRKNYWLFLALIPIVIAFPIVDGIFYAFVGWILGTIVISLLLTGNTATIKYPLLLLGLGAVSTILSFSLNWLYVGIPEIQPTRAFIPFIWMERFQHWSSMGLITYLYLTFDQTVSASSISIIKIVSNALALFSYPASALANQDFYSKLSTSYFPLPVAVLFIWIIILNLRKPHATAGTGRLTHKVFIYWLTFTSFYILKFVLTSIIQQGSLRRMFLFMDVMPIVTLFSLIIFLVHWFEGRFQASGGKGAESFIDKTIVFLVKHKHIAMVVASIMWGSCLSLSAANLWPYFWRRSFPTQLLILIGLLTAGAGLCFISLKRISRYYVNRSTDENVRRIASVSIFSLVVVVLLFPFTPISSNIPVPHTLIVSAMGDKNSTSSSSDVNLMAIIVDDQPVDFKSLKQSGDWVSEDGSIQSRDPAVLTYNFTGAWNSPVETSFEYGPSAGLVQIEYDDQAPVVKDLYSPEITRSNLLSQGSLFENRTSILLGGSLFIIEYGVIFGLMFFFLAFIPVRIVSASTFLLFALVLAFFQFQANAGFAKMGQAWQYFIGNEGSIQAYDPSNTFGVRSDVFHCLEILNQVPSSSQVFQINGLGAVEPCLFSPLLPRDKIVHYYESLAMTEPYYRTLMFGEAQTAYQMYRDLGINYFYLRKEDWLFANLGYSRAFEPQNLEQYFDVYAEADDFYILTWRGEGLHPVSAELAQEISIWYDRSKQNTQPNWWLGRQRLGDWVQAQP